MTDLRVLAAIAVACGLAAQPASALDLNLGPVSASILSPETALSASLPGDGTSAAVSVSPQASVTAGVTTPVASASASTSPSGAGIEFAEPMVAIRLGC